MIKDGDLVIVLPGQRRVKVRATHLLTREEILSRKVDWPKELEWVKHIKDAIIFSRYETQPPRKPFEHEHTNT